MLWKRKVKTMNEDELREAQKRYHARRVHLDKNGEDPKERHKQLCEDARNAFTKHQISRVVSPGHWLLQTPYETPPSGWDWTMAAEIVVFQGGKIVVWGDLFPVMFAYYGKFDDPAQVIHWMGKNEDIGYYVHQKAVIGSGKESIDEWDSDVARFELLRAVDERLEEVDDYVDSLTDPALRALDDAIDICDDGDEGEADAREFLTEKLSRMMGEKSLLSKFEGVPQGQFKETLERVRKERARETYREQDPFISTVEEAAQHYLGEGPHGLYSFLYSKLDYDALEGLGVGMVMSAKVYYAHAALARLSYLLDLEKEKESEQQRKTEANSGAAPPT
jgi:hypothetical protein